MDKIMTTELFGWPHYWKFQIFEKQNTYQFVLFVFIVLLLRNSFCVIIKSVLRSYHLSGLGACPTHAGLSYEIGLPSK